MSITSEEFYRIKRKVSTDCNLTGDELKTNEHFKMFGRFSKYYTCPGTVASKVNYRKRVLENPSNQEVQTMKIMNRQVRQAESTNLSKKALNKSRVHCNCDHWNSQSDQKIASIIVNNNVPSRGDSRRTSLTRHRPGASSAPGKGVDIKHNSYNRYLLCKKGLIVK
jgi:hypothetical protein